MAGRPNEVNIKIQDNLELIRKYYKFGLIDRQVCELIGIGESSLNRYKEKNPKIWESIKSEKQKADAEVVASLYKRAIGFEYEELKQEGIESDGKLKVKSVTKFKKYMAPDTAAAFIWLKNRQPETWKDKQEIFHSGGISNPLLDKLSKLPLDELKKIAGLE
jgi:hypothetical protein